jgi:Na+/H+ antiporter NhaD/arsenite permease-like protein
MMKIYCIRILMLISLCYVPNFVHAATNTSNGSTSPRLCKTQQTNYEPAIQETVFSPGNQANHKVEMPPVWLALPFILLLLMLATGPLLYPQFWHQHYPKIAIGLAVSVLSYYIVHLHNLSKPLEAMMEYLQFIALISALYMAAGGILIKIRSHPYPTLVNIGILLTGAVLANLIGTTGASMLLIRPYIRFNSNRSKVFHIIFFILIVSNIGGALTPIGDPPLFLGFLKGVPFFWNLAHNLAPWALTLGLLIVAFYIFDTRHTKVTRLPNFSSNQPFISIQGKRNFGWLVMIILAVFVDPNLFGWLPEIHYHGHSFSFIREIILLSIAALSYYFASKPALQGNVFSIEPLREIVIIFIGIFGTMAPALSLISAYAQSPGISKLITPNTLYWATGAFSSVLDNAPTYLNFLAASMASQGGDLLNPIEVKNYAQGGIFAYSLLRLKAISIAAVFFGALTYIGNGPNFMVKSIAEQLGIPMPSFVGYSMRFAIPLLLPILILIWFIYFFSA